MSWLLQDLVWRHFGQGRQAWVHRCARCQDHAREVKELPREALECWKLEVWYSMWETADADYIDQVLLNWAMEEPQLAGKLSREPLPVVASDERQAPYPAGNVSRVALIYLWQAREVNVCERELSHRLAAQGAGQGTIHRRRGCWAYDELFGCWTSWPHPATDP